MCSLDKDKEICMNNTNSVDWWNEYFKETWEYYDGPKQTEYFMNHLLSNLPDHLIALLDKEKSILDWGCAMGQGTAILTKKFPRSSVVGMDFSQVAIERAKVEYPEGSFLSEEIEKSERNYDVIITSNCLEHFDDPIEILNKHLEYTDEYYILLVPYEEEPLSEYHNYKFTENTFPHRLRNFKKSFQKVIDMSGDVFWNGSQLLVVYEKESIDIKEKVNELESSSPEIWDKVADAYVNDIIEPDIEIANSLEDILLNLKISKNAKLLELGSGSGHLSGLLSKSGYDVTCLDFSENALKKAKAFFDENAFEGKFIKSDIFDLDVNKNDYDVLWNSGVMEHFTDSELEILLKTIRKHTSKYFVFLVPNPESVSYLLFRQRLMKYNQWSYGREYLREDYKRYIEAAGFRLIGEQYVSKEMTKFMFEASTSDPLIANEFRELVDNDFVTPKEYYLKAYICEVLSEDTEGLEIPRFSDQISSGTEIKTLKFDYEAMLRGKDEHIGNLEFSKNNEVNSLSQEKNDLSQKIELLSRRLDDTEKRLLETENLTNEQKYLIEQKETEIADQENMINNQTVKISSQENLIVDQKEQFKVKQEETDELRRIEQELNDTLKMLEQESKDKLETLEQESNDKLKILEQESNDKLKRVQQESNNLHSELMKLSDWASEINERLKLYESSRLVKKSLKFVLFKRRITTTYSSRGIWGSFREFGKKAFKKVAPKLYSEKVVKKRVVDLQKSLNDGNGKLIIAFPVITWFFRWQRPQQILSRFAENGYTVVYLSMGINPLGRLYDSGTDAIVDINITNLGANIYKLWVHSYDDMNIYTDPLEGWNLNNLFWSIFPILDELEFKDLLYMVQLPNWSNLVFRLKEHFMGQVVFDCMDDHSGFSTNTDEAVAVETNLIEQADLVIVSADKLEEKVVEYNESCAIVRNGTEYEHFNAAFRNGKLDFISDKPIIGYYGAISDWFDMDIILHCAESKPDWNFVLIGSTFGAEIEEVEKLKNVHFLGEIPYKELPGYLGYFDVCTIPFKIIPLTLATNPVKFYEYLSAGKPVVSVELPELKQYSHACYLAQNKDDFLDNLGQALRDKDESALIEMRLKLARENSWQSRFEEMNNAVEKES